MIQHNNTTNILDESSNHSKLITLTDTIIVQSIHNVIKLANVICFFTSVNKTELKIKKKEQLDSFNKH